jgi:lipoprotein-releasing system permease protein
MYEYDANLAIASLRSVQDFFHMQSRINAIEVRIDDIYAAPQIKKAIQSVVGARFYARDWMEMNRNLFSSLKLQKFVFFIILTLIILVAAFNIASTLIMNVLEKEREIAILKTMGATNRGIMSIFMIQGLLIGFAGTLIGISMAYITGYLINSYDLIKLPADIYYLGNLTARMKLSDFIIVSISAIIISFISTLYPAWKASRINPIEPLRYE